VLPEDIPPLQHQVCGGRGLGPVRGESAPPVVESPTGSGHHRAITLAFPGGLAGGGAKRLELIVRDLGGVKERVLRWDAPFAGN